MSLRVVSHVNGHKKLTRLCFMIPPTKNGDKDVCRISKWQEKSAKSRHVFAGHAAYFLCLFLTWNQFVMLDSATARKSDLLPWLEIDPMNWNKWSNFMTKWHAEKGFLAKVLLTRLATERGAFNLDAGKCAARLIGGSWLQSRGAECVESRAVITERERASKWSATRWKSAWSKCDHNSEAEGDNSSSRSQDQLKTSVPAQWQKKSEPSSANGTKSNQNNVIVQ